jgi:hypothetical protein
MATNTVTFQKLASAMPNDQGRRPMPQPMPMQRPRPGINVLKLLSLGLIARKSPTAGVALVDAGEEEARRFMREKIRSNVD